eukprot:TRINITY_DN21739_c0_g1_i1.p1 TRINITY_DN21739_c0_g1~~TRINITY_DN21739_c0_g1_i1.p1  ORF type:complete len:205 (-),score=15.89 TRINITY_DN21739_c0_g1_i1:125-739(-)
MGLVSTLGAVLSAFMGLHYGHIITNFQSHSARISHSLLFAALLLGLGALLRLPLQLPPHHDGLSSSGGVLPDWLALSYPGMPPNAYLYTLTYVLLTAAAAAAVMTLVYIIVDAAQVHFYTRPLEWAGTNSLFLFAATATPLVTSLVAGFYWDRPEENLVAYFHKKLLDWLPDMQVVAIATAVLKVVVWFLFAGALDWQGIHMRL